MTKAGALKGHMVGVVAFALLGAAPLTSAQERRPATAEAPAVPEIASEPQGLITEPVAIQRAVLFGDRHLGRSGMTNGLYSEFGQMIPGAGWISFGPGYRRWYAEDSFLVETSAALSWRGYKTAQARFELPKLARSRITLGSQLRWQDFTQVSFFGENPDAIEENRSEYRLRSTNVVGYASVRPVQRVALEAKIGWLKPSILPRAGTFKRDYPDTRALFPGNIVFALPNGSTFVHSEAAIEADTRDFPGHTLRGGLYRVGVANYSDRNTGLFSFRRYEAEAAHFVPLADGRLVIAAHGWLVGSDTSDGRYVPFHLQPTLGGHNTLRSYADFRFHDRNLVVVNAEARVSMMTHVDAAAFIDAGNVAGRIGDLNLDRRSYGAGLRLHSRRQTFARLDVAHGDEGWRLLFRLNDPLNLARLSRRTAAVPFVP